MLVPIFKNPLYVFLFSSGELREFYSVASIAVIGGSFIPGLTGHNLSEAAAAGCAVITGSLNDKMRCLYSMPLSLFYLNHHVIFF